MCPLKRFLNLTNVAVLNMYNDCHVNKQNMQENVYQKTE